MEAAIAARRRTMQCIAFDSHRQYTRALGEEDVLLLEASIE
jgi:hypothetical protein